MPSREIVSRPLLAAVLAFVAVLAVVPAAFAQTNEGLPADASSPYLGSYVDIPDPASLYAPPVYPGAVVPTGGGPVAPLASGIPVSVGPGKPSAPGTGREVGDGVPAGIVSRSDILTLGAMGVIAVTAFGVVGARRRFR